MHFVHALQACGPARPAGVHVCILCSATGGTKTILLITRCMTSLLLTRCMTTTFDPHSLLLYGTASTAGTKLYAWRACRRKRMLEASAGVCADSACNKRNAAQAT